MTRKTPTTDHTITLDLALGIKMPKLVLPVPAEVRTKYLDAPDRIVVRLREPTIVEQRTMMTPVESATTNDELFDAVTDLLLPMTEGVERDVLRAVIGVATASAMSQLLVAVQTGELPDPKEHQQLLLASLTRVRRQLLTSM